MKQAAILRARLLPAIAAMCLLLGAALPYSAKAQDQASSRSVTPMRGSFPAVLSKSIDSKKLKEGDTVVCQTFATLHAQSGALIPSGSKIIGHVTQSQARSKGDPQSSLAMVFDKIEVGKGEELPINGVLQAVAPSLGDTGPQAGPATPGTTLGGSGQASGGTVAPPTTMQLGGGVHPMLNSQSKGVLGFKNIEMDDNHVITSTGKEVKLDNGTQMMIRAE
jgi:hypothetical protein